MPQKSPLKKKNRYLQSRESKNISREVASEKTGIGYNRIRDIDTDPYTLPTPEEVVLMASAYNDTMLCNYYCSHDCKIGQKYVPEIKIASLPQISLEMIVSINQLNNMKDRLAEITVDGEISEEELPDFKEIQSKLEELSEAVDALKLWMDTTVASGKVNINYFE